MGRAAAAVRHREGQHVAVEARRVVCRFPARTGRPPQSSMARPASLTTTAPVTGGCRSAPGTVPSGSPPPARCRRTVHSVPPVMVSPSTLNVPIQVIGSGDAARIEHRALGFEVGVEVQAAHLAPVGIGVADLIARDRPVPPAAGLEVGERQVVPHLDDAASRALQGLVLELRVKLRQCRLRKIAAEAAAIHRRRHPPARQVECRFLQRVAAPRSRPARAPAGQCRSGVSRRPRATVRLPDGRFVAGYRGAAFWWRECSYVHSMR